MARHAPFDAQRRRLAGILCVGGYAQSLISLDARAASRLTIATGPENGTYYQVGKDLKRILAPEDGVDLRVATSRGSVENILRLNYAATRSRKGQVRLEDVSKEAADDPGAGEVALALVQADVVQAYLGVGAGGNLEAKQLVAPLRLILPMYTEELHFVVRQGDQARFVHEIEKLRINAGEMGSGSAVTAQAIYQKMFRRPIAQQTYFSHEEGLNRLAEDDGVDVELIVAGQPANLLRKIDPKVAARLRFLEAAFEDPGTLAALNTYVSTRLRSLRDYGRATPPDVPALGVRAYLVTHVGNSQAFVGPLIALARALCGRLPELQRGDERFATKWTEVRLPIDSNAGDHWNYFEPTERVLRLCRSEPPKQGNCSPQEANLGLCRPAQR